MKKPKMNRRDFIKTGSSAFFIAAAGKAIGAGAPSNRVRLAQLGCREGCRGIWLMRAGIAMPDVEIATVCDVDSRGREFAAAEVEKKTGKKPKIEVDLRKILQDKEIDGVLLEIPDHWHTPGAYYAMKAGKAVYVEKPCSFCGKEAEILVKTQKETGAVLQVGNQRRSSDVYRMMMKRLPELIGTPKWARCWYTSNRGDGPATTFTAPPEWLNWEIWQGPAPRRQYRDGLVHYNWHWTRHYGTGEVGNNGPHYLDVSRWALGVDFPIETSSLATRVYHADDGRWEWPDVQTASYKFTNGTFIQFECYCNTRFLPYRDIGTGAMIFGDRGAVMFDPQDAVFAYDKTGKEIQKIVDPSAAEWIQTTTGASYLDTNHLANFVEAIKKNDPEHCFVPAREGAASTMMALTANLAADTGKVIRLDAKTGALRNTEADVVNRWSREYAKGWEIA